MGDRVESGPAPGWLFVAIVTAVRVIVWYECCVNSVNLQLA